MQNGHSRSERLVGRTSGLDQSAPPQPNSHGTTRPPTGGQRRQSFSASCSPEVAPQHSQGYYHQSPLHQATGHPQQTQAASQQHPQHDLQQRYPPGYYNGIEAQQQLAGFDQLQRHSRLSTSLLPLTDTFSPSVPGFVSYDNQRTSLSWQGPNASASSGESPVFGTGGMYAHSQRHGYQPSTTSGRPPYSRGSGIQSGLAAQGRGLGSSTDAGGDAQPSESFQPTGCNNDTNTDVTNHVGRAGTSVPSNRNITLPNVVDKSGQCPPGNGHPFLGDTAPNLDETTANPKAAAPAIDQPSHNGEENEPCNARSSLGEDGHEVPDGVKLQFSSMTRAQAHLGQVLWKPSSGSGGDTSIPSSDGEQRDWIKKFITAIRDMTNIQDNQGARAVKHLRNNQWSSEQIELKAWKLLKNTIKLHREGFKVNHGRDITGKGSEGRELQCGERLADLCTLLKERKTAVEELMTGRNMYLMIAWPLKHSKDKKSNQHGNNLKKAALEKARANASAQDTPADQDDTVGAVRAADPTTTVMATGTARGRGRKRRNAQTVQRPQAPVYRQPGAPQFSPAVNIDTQLQTEYAENLSRFHSQLQQQSAEGHDADAGLQPANKRLRTLLPEEDPQYTTTATIQQHPNPLSGYNVTQNASLGPNPISQLDTSNQAAFSSTMNQRRPHRRQQKVPARDAAVEAGPSSKRHRTRTANNCAILEAFTTTSEPSPVIIEPPVQPPYVEPPSLTDQYVTNQQLFYEQSPPDDQQPFMQQPPVGQSLTGQFFEQQPSTEQPPFIDPLFLFGQGSASSFDPTLNFDISTHDDLYAQMNSLAQQTQSSQTDADQALEPPAKRNRTAPLAGNPQTTGAANPDGVDWLGLFLGADGQAPVDPASYNIQTETAYGGTTNQFAGPPTDDAGIGSQPARKRRRGDDRPTTPQTPDAGSA